MLKQIDMPVEIWDLSKKVAKEMSMNRPSYLNMIIRERVLGDLKKIKSLKQERIESRKVFHDA